MGGMKTNRWVISPARFWSGAYSKTNRIQWFGEIAERRPTSGERYGQRRKRLCWWWRGRKVLGSLRSRCGGMGVLDQFDPHPESDQHSVVHHCKYWRFDSAVRRSWAHAPEPGSSLRLSVS